MTMTCIACGYSYNPTIMRDGKLYNESHAGTKISNTAGRKLTTLDVGKKVVRVYPEKLNFFGHDKKRCLQYDWGLIPLDPTDAATDLYLLTEVINVTAKNVVLQFPFRPLSGVTKEFQIIERINDRHWLTLEEYSKKFDSFGEKDEKKA